MDLGEDEKKAWKRARSEAQRLESIRAKKQLEKQRQSIMSQALREADHKSKRIVFSDSDEDKDDPSTNSQISSSKKTSAKRPKLFEESSSENDCENQLNIINRHEGKKGEKLMKLEARFNSDSRFQLDEKFASSESDEDENETVHERSKNLELLSKVLGSTVRPKKKTIKTPMKDTPIRAIRPFTRFDPFNEEHVRWLQKEQAKGAINGKEDEDESNERSASETVCKDDKAQFGGFYYEIQADFAEELKMRLAEESTAGSSTNDGGTGFSFLEMMRKTEPTDELKREDKEVDISPTEKLEEILRTGDDRDTANRIDAECTVPTSKLAGISTPTWKFFVTGDEPYLRSLVSNFKRTQSLEKIVPRWANQRDAFVKNYKHLRKAALREMKHKLLHDSNQTKNVDKKEKNHPRKRKAEKEERS